MIKYIHIYISIQSVILLCLACISVVWGQKAEIKEKGMPLVNQAGYNLNEAKRFTCPGAPDGTSFAIYAHQSSENPSTGKALFTGKISQYTGDFTAFNPRVAAQEYVIEVEGFGRSVPFWIADHLMEKLSSRLAYQFFIDVRGSTDPVHSNEANVAGGGPSRDGGAYTLEALYETLLYASNPALFDRWKEEMAPTTQPDLIDLILWHAEFAYHHIRYNGPTAHRPYMIGHYGQELQTYDYQNTLDQLAAVCAAYHTFLKPYLAEATYQKYRKACLDNWEKYERDKEVRYWVRSDKWIDEGWQEFNEMGNAYGQSVFRNVLMYLCEKEEKDGQPEKFLQYARQSAEDIIRNWKLNKPRHTWLARNAEHITPQALAFFMMVAPGQAPEGTREKLAAWRDYILKRTNNLWHYRTHTDTEWAHLQSKEVGNVAGLGGSMFAAAHLLQDSVLRSIGWSQVNFVFGQNPVGAHLSNKSEVRVQKGGYWAGVEKGWPYAHVEGVGRLGEVRGTLDGSPLNESFPYRPVTEGASKGGFGTEGWAVTNRAWMSTVTFSTVGSHQLRITDKAGKMVSRVKSGSNLILELKAALNQDWNKIETGWVEIALNGQAPQKITVTETGPNTGVFRATYKANGKAGDRISVSYGYLGFDKKADIIIY